MTATSPVLGDRRPAEAQPWRAEGALRRIFGTQPPAYRRGFLIRGIAHKLQELTYGPLEPAYQARLDAMIEGKDKPNGRSGRRPRQDVHLLARAPSCCASGGASCTRSRSSTAATSTRASATGASAVARAITRTRWLGPLFFGLRKTGTAAHEPT